MTERQAFSRDLAELVLWCFENGFLVEEGEGWRPQFVQCTYHYFGYSKKHEGGLHGLRLAHDFIFWDHAGYIDFKDPEQPMIKIRLGPVGDYWKSIDPKNVWGGDWTKPFDPGHFERRV